jgi:predicted ATPase/DNA-binding CsgD family transcriptional regulator
VLDRQVGNLPAQLSSFIGRDLELAELKPLLSQVRLLTLTGVGGCGKTRLGIQLASAARDRFRDGVWFVDLASVSSPAQVPLAMAAALKVAEKPGRSLEESLWDELAPNRLLIVLDNCEHLIESSATLAAAALAACPALQIIATSREALNIPGELSWRVPPLRQPDAIKLFLERAAMSRSSSAATGLHKQQVADLCQRLDGLPLALELAAVRLRAMPLEEIVARLEDRFRLLSAGSRTALPRQQTLRATVDWSYELLTETERALFRRLSVFVGGFDLASAEAICSGDGLGAGDVLERLPQLVDRSMVQAEESVEGAARYRLLETLRQYGAEQLQVSGEADRFRSRHAEDFLVRAEGADSQGPGQQVYVLWIGRDHDNLQAAIDWLAGHDPVRRLRLAAALCWFWIMRSQNREGRQQLEAALASSPDRTALRAKALRALGHMTRSLGDISLARDELEEALAISEERHDESDVAFTLLILGTSSAIEGDPAGAWTYYERALAVYERLGDRRGVARMQSYLGIQSFGRRDLPRAEAFLEQSLPGLRESKDDTFTANALVFLGMVALDLGQLKRTASLLAESLSLSRPQGNHFAITHALDAMAGLAAAHQQHERALQLAGASSAARDASGLRLPPHLLAPRDRWLEPARRRLGKKAADQAWELGRRLKVNDAIAYGLGETEKVSSDGLTPTLTRREKEIAELVSQGLTNRQIADRLVLSVRTAESHVESVRNKLGFQSRAQIAAWFVENR